MMQRRIHTRILTQRMVFCVSVFICFCIASLEVKAQHKHVTNTKSIGIGYQALQDTYLSPMHYHGVEGRLMTNTIRENDSTRWARMIMAELWVSSTESRSKNGGMISGALSVQYGIAKTWNLLDDRLKIHAGGMGEMILGGTYNTRAGNNLGNTRVQLNIGPIARAEYKISKYTLGYEVSAPLCGLAFSPNYGQSYYEIWEGNYDHNIVPTTFVSIPSLRHQLTFTMPLKGKYHLTMGYLGDYRQQAVNSLKQHIYSHMFILGLTRKW